MNTYGPSANTGPSLQGSPQQAADVGKTARSSARLGGRVRRSAALAAVVTVLLTMLGSMLDYATIRGSRGGAPSYLHAISAWSSDRQSFSGSIAVPQLHAPLFGIPLTIGALLLLAGATLALRRAGPGRRFGHTGALTMLAGAGVQFGTVSAVLLDLISRSTYREQAADAMVISTEPGFWLLIVAGVLAIAAALLAVLAGRARIG